MIAKKRAKKAKSAKRTNAEKCGEAIHELALGYPEATQSRPWGEIAVKVKGKTFLFMRSDREGLSLSVKLPSSGRSAVKRPFAQPTRYGLGKSGWVTCEFAPNDQPPLALLRQWLDESYRAIAPKALAALVPGAGSIGP
jgi:hypothetical protein